MKKKYTKPAVLSLLGLVGVFSALQTLSFKKKLQPELASKVQEVLDTYRVHDGSVEMKLLNANIEGICHSEPERVQITKKVTEIGYKEGQGAVRVAEVNNKLRVYGTVDVEKKGGHLHVNGKLSSPKEAMDALQGVREGSYLGLSQSEDLTQNGYFIDPEVISHEGFQGWAQEYFILTGDRGLKVSASDNKLVLYGEMTEKLKNRVIRSAQKAGLQAESEFKIIDPTPAELFVSRKGGELEVKGQLADDYDLELLKPVTDTSKIILDPFTEEPPKVSGPAFGEFMSSYFKPGGDRSFTLTGKDIKLKGLGTPFLKKDWLYLVDGLGLEAEEFFELFPSVYHFPSYQVSSQIDSAKLNEAQSAFELNEILFDTGASEISKDEMPKISSLAETLNGLGEGVSYIIGGHADATGDMNTNLRLSAARAQAVVDALKDIGVDDSLFTISSFGSTKAKSEGSNANDRRVEILIK